MGNTSQNHVSRAVWIYPSSPSSLCKLSLFLTHLSSGAKPAVLLFSLCTQGFSSLSLTSAGWTGPVVLIPPSMQPLKHHREGSALGWWLREAGFGPGWKGRRFCLPALMANLVGCRGWEELVFTHRLFKLCRCYAAQWLGKGCTLLWERWRQPKFKTAASFHLHYLWRFWQCRLCD